MPLKYGKMVACQDFPSRRLLMRCQGEREEEPVLLAISLDDIKAGKLQKRAGTGALWWGNIRPLEFYCWRKKKSEVTWRSCRFYLFIFFLYNAFSPQGKNSVCWLSDRDATQSKYIILSFKSVFVWTEAFRNPCQTKRGFMAACHRLMRASEWCKSLLAVSREEVNTWWELRIQPTPSSLHLEICRALRQYWFPPRLRALLGLYGVVGRHKAAVKSRKKRQLAFKTPYKWKLDNLSTQFTFSSLCF